MHTRDCLKDVPWLLDRDNHLIPASFCDTPRRWFSSEMGSLPSEKKYRLLPYIWRTRKTTVPQLARVFGLDRETVRQILKVP